MAGCQQSVSIGDRIDSFIEDLNTQDRTHVYKNFDKDRTAQYAQIAIPAFWALSFPVPDATGSYSITNLDDSNSLKVSGTISGPVGFPTKPIYFMMSQDSDDNWYIQQMDWIGDFVAPIVKKLW